jgi:hypothetical protein
LIYYNYNSFIFFLKSIYNTQSKVTNYDHDYDPNVISVDATRRKHDHRLNQVMEQFQSSYSSKSKSSSSKSNSKRYDIDDDDEDDIVAMMDRL